MIFIFMGFAISIFSFVNYKKSMVLFLILRLFWHPSIVIIQGDSIPSITLSLLMDIVFLISFFSSKRNTDYSKVKFPYTMPLTIIAVSYFLTCFFSVAGFGSELTRAISMILENIVFIWLIWKSFDTEKDLNCIIKYFSISFFVITLYGIFEYYTKTNPFIDYKNDLLDGGIVLYSSTSQALKRGYRLISVMEHPIGAGMTLALFVIFICVTLVIYNEKFPRYYKFYKFILLGIILIGFAYPLLNDNINIFLSLFNKSAQKSVGGSSWEQRLSQLDAVVSLLKMSPIGGLGEKFESIVVNQYTVAALGYESVWFIQMTRHGIVGIFANLFLAYYSVIKIPGRYHSKPVFFLSLSYWIVYTLTSIPSFRTELYYLLLFYFIKKTDVYKKQALMVKQSNSHVL